MHYCTRGRSTLARFARFGLPLLWLSLGCQTPVDGALSQTATSTAAAARRSSAGEPVRRLVRVDPTLIGQGRVATTEVVAFAFAGQSVIPGEVTPAPDGEAEVGSLVAGRIASLDAVEGGAVSKGQILAWIDAPEIGSTRADLARANAHLVAAQQRLDRQLALQRQGATSQSAVDESSAAMLSAKADQQGALSKLGSVGVSGAGSTGRLALRSPIDGIVVARHAALGGAVTPEATLFRIVNPRTLRVRARWSETLGPIPEVNTLVQLSVRTNPGVLPAPSCEAHVETHLGLVDSATRSIALQIKPGPNCPKFTLGGYVDARVADARAKGAASGEGWAQVPLEAVVDLRGLSTVFLAQSEPGVFEVRTVAAKPSVGNIVPIELGLTAGETVAVKGVVLLKGEALGDMLGGE